MDLLPSLGRALVPVDQSVSPGGEGVPASQLPSFRLSAPPVPQAPVSNDFVPERSNAELQSILEAKECELADLQEHIDFLKQEPLELEDRLKRLESQFGQLRHGEVVRLKAPALHSIMQAVREDDSYLHMKALEHEKGVAENKLGADAARYDAEEGYTKAASLKLGRGCMWLDQEYLNRLALQKKESEEKHHHAHPSVNGFHYSGHVARPLEAVDPVFKTAHGDTKRDIKGASQGGFWLDCFDHKLAHIHSQVPTQPLGQFTVTLNRPGGENLGLSVHVSRQESIFIESVGKGLVAHWNENNKDAVPPQSIQPGDRIIVVNGKRTAQDMLDELSPSSCNKAPYINFPNSTSLSLTLFREDPMIQYVTRHDEMGQGTDHFPVDWLGQVKSGEPEPVMRRPVPKLETIAAWLA